MTPTEAVEITNLFLREFGSKYTVRITDDVSYVGLCSSFHREISISSFYLDMYDWQFSYDTIKHEIAHAISHDRKNHGKIWQEYFLLIGGSSRNIHPYSKNVWKENRKNLVVSSEEFLDRYNKLVNDKRRERGKQLAALKRNR